MNSHVATVAWAREGAVFTDGRYSRAHVISFDGGVSIAGSASPANVPAGFAKEDAADPEELLVAAVSSCHMLWFLDFARRAGFRPDVYEDAAVGVMGKDDRGRMAVTKVTLHPRIAWSGEATPDADALASLHHKAHDACFIANSIRADVIVEACD